MSDAKDDPRTYFAAERTFLAWIRTGLGLIGVGFAVSRFGLFLHQLQAAQGDTAAQRTGLSVFAGVALVALGIVVNIAAVVSHIRTVQRLRSDTWVAGRISTMAVTLAVILSLMGVGIGIYLLYLR